MLERVIDPKAHRAGHRPQKSEQMRSWNLVLMFTTQLNHSPFLLGYRAKYFLLAYFSLNVHRAGHRPQRKVKSYWELRTWNLGQIFKIEYLMPSWWLVNNTVKSGRYLFWVADCLKKNQPIDRRTIGRMSEAIIAMIAGRAALVCTLHFPWKKIHHHAN